MPDVIADSIGPLNGGSPTRIDTAAADRPPLAHFDYAALIPPAVITLGIALRLSDYLRNYSLNHDDICLALNLIQRDAAGLMRTLDFDQAAPLGFLWMERLVVVAIGYHERALRLLPLLFGCAALPLMWRVAIELMPDFEAIIALGLFAFSQALIEAGAQVKPYSLDLLAALVILAVCLPLLGEAIERGQLIVAGTAGSLLLWFSFPAVFVLAGMGGVIAATGVFDYRVGRLRRLLGVLVAWTISGALAYRFSMRPGLLNLRLARIDAPHMFPLHTPQQWVSWLAEAVNNLGSISTSVRLAPLMALAILFAIAVAFSWRDRTGMLLIAPLAVCLFAAIAGRYPWFPRLLFFTAPLTLIFTARELGQLVRDARPGLRLAVIFVVCAVLLYSGLSAFKNIVRPDAGFDDPRGAVAAIAKNWQAGDRIYASDAAMPVIIYYRLLLRDYYGPMLRVGKTLDFVSSRNPAYTAGEPEQIVPLPKRVGRLWFLYFQPDESGFDRRILGYFNQRGSLISESQYKHYTAALWNLQSGPGSKS
jgi:hypothetical protein